MTDLLQAVFLCAGFYRPNWDKKFRGCIHKASYVQKASKKIVRIMAFPRNFP